MKTIRALSMAASFTAMVVTPVYAATINFDRFDLLTSTVTTQEQIFFRGLTANPSAPPLFGAPALPPDATFTLPLALGTTDSLFSLQGKFYRFNFNLPPGFSDLTFKLDIVVNDEIAIYINDVVVAIEDDTTAVNFFEPTPEFILNADGTVTDNSNPITGWDFLSINQSLFQAGNNELSIYGVDTCCGQNIGGPPRQGSLAFLSGQITFTTPTPDHFVGYDVEEADDTEEFEERVVFLSDQFESAFFEVEEPERLYNPADKNGEGISDPDTHLVGYEIERADDTPKHQPMSVKMTDQFGELFLDTRKPDRLLVPSLKSLEGPIPDEVLPDGFSVDHFKCYKVEPSEGADEFIAVQVTLADQFQTKLFDVKKPERLCTPVEKTMGSEVTSIQNPDQHLLCYKIKRAEGEPKHERVANISTNNQFGRLSLETKKERCLCVPAEKEVLGLAPGGGEVDDNGEDAD